MNGVNNTKPSYVKKRSEKTDNNNNRTLGACTRWGKGKKWNRSKVRAYLKSLTTCFNGKHCKSG